MSCKKKQRLTSEIEYSPVCLDTQSSIFDLIPNEILGVIALFLDADINFDTRKSFFETCKRFRDIGYIVFDSSVQSNLPLRYAARKGYTNEVKRLLKDTRVNPSDLTDEALCLASAKGQQQFEHIHVYYETVTSYFTKTKIYEEIKSLICDPLHNNYTEIVELLIKDDRVSSSSRKCQPFINSVIHGDISMVKSLLSKFPTIFNLFKKHDIIEHKLIQLIVVFGHLHILQYMYEIGFFPENAYSMIIDLVYIASQYGHLHIIKYLWKNINVFLNKQIYLYHMPCYFSLGFHTAVKIGYINIVKWFVKKQLDPCEYNNGLIHTACESSHTEIVAILLTDGVVDPSDWDSKQLSNSRYNPDKFSSTCLGVASLNGNTEIVKMLMQDDRVDPAICDQFAICSASANGHEDVVKILLEDERVDPSVKDNEALWGAVKNNNIKIVKLLLNHSSIDYWEVTSNMFFDVNGLEKRRKGSTIIFKNANIVDKFLHVLDEYRIKNCIRKSFNF